MTKKVMDVRASDNKYLHRDFHASADIGLRYIGEKYGDNGVKEYLQTFARAYYKPLFTDVGERGLVALKEQIEKIYQIQDMPEVVHENLTADELDVPIDRCPAVTYFNKTGHNTSKWYVELTRTVNDTIADQCDLGFELLAYSEETGAARYRFFKRAF